MNINKSLKVLVAPLNWGLGHAARCVPLIQKLRAAGHRVILGGDGASLALLRDAFPVLQAVELPAQEIRYPRNGALFVPAMIGQLPKALKNISADKRVADDIAAREKLDLIISDNRYGCYSKGCRSVLLTHQLHIKTGNAITDLFARAINRRLIKNFDAVWVPDNRGPENLSGALSHPPPSLLPVSFIGPLSRFEEKKVERYIEVVAVLSGPEPQRTIFEELIVKAAAHVKGTVYMVRGLPRGGREISDRPANMKVFDHLGTTALNDVMSAAKLIIARSGYSTVMDLQALKQHAILIPTPGQAEQEYLAESLSEKKYCVTAEQSGLDLMQLISEFRNSEFSPWPEAETGLDHILEDLVARGF